MWLLWSSKVAQSSHISFAPHDRIFFSHSPSCHLWYPCTDLKRGCRWKAVKFCLLWHQSIVNVCQKSPTLSLNVLKTNKGPSPFSSAPNRWQMWRSLVMWAFSCWVRKPVLTFYKKSSTLFSSKLVPLTDKQEGKKVPHLTWKDHNKFTTQDSVKN